MDFKNDISPDAELLRDLGARFADSLAHALESRLDARFEPRLPEFEALLPRQNQILELLEPLAKQRLTEDQFQAELHAHDARLASLKSELEAAEARIAERQGALETAERQAGDLAAGLASAAEERSVLLARIDQLKTELEQQRADHEDARAALLAAQSAEKDGKSRIATLENDAAAAAATSAQLRELKDTLRQQERERDQAREDTTALRTQLAQSAKEVAKARAMHAATTATPPPATTPAAKATAPAIAAPSRRNPWAWATVALFCLLLALQGVSLNRERTLRREMVQHRALLSMPSEIPLPVPTPLPAPTAASTDAQSAAGLKAVEQRLVTLQDNTVRVVEVSGVLMAEMNDIKDRIAAANALAARNQEETSGRVLAILHKLDVAPPLAPPAAQPTTAPTTQPTTPSAPQSAAKAPIRAVIPFGLGAVDPTAEAACLIENVAEQLRAAGARSILVIGHTDPAPIRGELRDHYGDNAALSQARAASVAKYLAKYGIDRQTQFIYGLGATMPAAGNDTPENRARNRRVEIVGW